MTESVHAAFERQASICRALGSPFNAELCQLLVKYIGHASRFGQRLAQWPGDAAADALALRACGALNALARQEAVRELVAAYPPHMLNRQALDGAIALGIAQHDQFLADYLDSAPQTNEVARSAVVLAGCLTLAQRAGLPLALYEIGASAGLNLLFDRYHYRLGEARYGDEASPVRIECQWQGALPPFDAPLTVSSRQGSDLQPIDPDDGQDRERLLSYIWPDQLNRVVRTQAALCVMGAAACRVEQGDAAAWVEKHFSATGGEGEVRLLLHTVVWQYLPDETQQAIERTMQRAGQAATAQAPIAWLSMEADRAGDGAGVTLRLWPGDECLRLGRADFHGRWVEWQGA